MSGQGAYFYENPSRGFASGDGGFYGVARPYPGNDIYQRSQYAPLPPAGPQYLTIDRQAIGPNGDLYTTVDRNRDRTGPGPMVNADPKRSPAVDRRMTGQHVYDLDHLATFAAAGVTPGRLLSPPEGVRRVREMAQAGAVWPLRVQIIISGTAVIVIDARNGEEMENFPLALVSDPTCATAVDRRIASSEILSNLVIFTVLEDRTKATSPPEMHIFQCIGRLGQEFVDDILAAKAGKYSGKPTLPETRVPAFGQQRQPQDVAYDNMQAAERTAMAASRYQGGPAASQMFRQSMQRDGWESGERQSPLNEATQRSVTLLDRCFSDIEQFVTKIQRAANAFKELDNRRSIRVNKASQQYGDGLLGMRARPPPAKDFIDILQKFKLSFILLARLKAHIRDPNAPELVQFLFTPLALIIDASRGDTQASGVPAELASRVIAPLPTTEAHDLLDNCLTSKQNELLESLGPAWTTSIERWRGEVPPYIPRFYDGWQPPAFWIEEIGVPTVPTSVASLQPNAQYWRENGQLSAAGGGALRGGYARSQGSDSSSLADREVRNIDVQKRLAQDYQRQRDLDVSRDMARIGIQEKMRGKSPDWDRTDGPSGIDRSRQARAQSPDWDRISGEREQQLLGSRPAASSKPQPSIPNVTDDRVRPQDSKMSGSSGEEVANGKPAMPTASQDFLRELKAKGAKIYRVKNDRESKNQKELSVKSGDIVEVLDDQKNWWKVRNVSSGIGFVPKTLLEAYTA